MTEDDESLGSHRLWANFRYGVVGPLLSAPPGKGELADAIKRLAILKWRHPVTGDEVLFKYSTIEGWYYLAKKSPDPIAKLRWKTRSDLGRSRAVTVLIGVEVGTLYGQFPFWSYQLMADNIRALIKMKPELGKVPGYQAMRRYMKNKGFRKARKPRNWERPSVVAAVKAAATQEIRSWEREHFGSLWHLDFHHSPLKVITADGTWVTPVLLAVIDDYSRLCCHMQWFINETTENLVHGFMQALMKRQMPVELMEDNGSQMVSEEFLGGLAANGILVWRTRPASPYQNGKNEFIWNLVDGRLMAMLENYKDLDLKTLNDLTQAWAEMEYNRRYHSEIKTSPLQRFLEAKDVGKPCPDLQTLKFRFQREVSRKQRRSDGSISLDGRRYEIPSRLRHFERVTLKYARWDYGFVHVVDPRTGEPIARIFPVDKVKNGEGIRRPVEDPVVIKPTPLTSELPPLLKQCREDYDALGFKPAYIPKDEHI